MNAKHFAGLDGLRFVSITFVVLHHLFTFKTNFGFGEYDYPVLGLIGLYGIHFFFMGSGFLITYLLLSEVTANSKINLKHFFLRRILRIWPAYYLLIFLAFVILLQSPFFHIPGTTDAYLAADYKKSNLFYFSFLPHVQPFIFPTGPFVHHTYTIGIEEQFYILWGVLFAFIRKRIFFFFILLLIACPLLNVLHTILINQNTENETSVLAKYAKSAITYIRYSRFSTFAIGSLFGWAYYHQKTWINLFKRRDLQLVLYMLLVVSIAAKVNIPFIQDEYMAFLMAGLMLTATFKQESLINYSGRWLTSLGKISYGIYLFHIIAIVLSAKAANWLFGTKETLTALLFLITLAMSLSILFGYISYYYFEVVFLKIKRRFRKIKTAHD